MGGAVRQLLWERAPRVATAAVGAALLLLGLEASIGHFAGSNGVEVAQWAPAVFSVPAGGLLISGLSLRLSVPRVRALARWIGHGAILLGVAGQFFHLRALWRELDGASLFDWASAEGALSVAPPPLAPATFAAMGLLLLVLASPELVLARRSLEPR